MPCMYSTNNWRRNTAQITANWLQPNKRPRGPRLRRRLDQAQVAAKANSLLLSRETSVLAYRSLSLWTTSMLILNTSLFTIVWRRYRYDASTTISTHSPIIVELGAIILSILGRDQAGVWEDTSGKVWWDDFLWLELNTYEHSNIRNPKVVSLMGHRDHDVNRRCLGCRIRP